MLVKDLIKELQGLPEKANIKMSCDGEGNQIFEVLNIYSDSDNKTGFEYTIYPDETTRRE